MEIANSSSLHHIEYIGRNGRAKQCSWPIILGYDIIEAYMTRKYVAWIHSWNLCHRMCPDERQWRLPTAHHFTISIILDAIDELNNAHGPFGPLFSDMIS